MQTLIHGIVVLDGAGVISHANVMACQILGLSADELRGRVISDRPEARDDGKPWCPPQLLPALRALRTKQWVHDVIGGDDGPVPGGPLTSVTAEPLIDPETAEIRSIIVALCEAPESTLDREFRDLIEVIPDPVVIVDPEGLILTANNHAETVFGYSRHELLGASVDQLLPERFQRSHASARANYATHPHERTMGGGLELAGRRKGGEEFPAEVSLKPIQTDQGPIVVCLIRDTTARKHIENALWESEERFRAVVQNSSDIIAIIDTNRAIRYTSPSREHILGYPPDTAPGWLRSGYVHPEDRSIVEDAFREVCREPGATVSAEYRYLNANGTWVHLESVAQNLTDDPSIRGIVVNTRDITARKQADAARQEVTRQLETALRELQSAQRQIIQQERLHALGQMASGIAHDFNNALAPIVGYLDILLEDYPNNALDPATVKSYLEWMRTAADDAASIIQRLREFYRERAGGTIITSIALPHLVEQAVTLTTPRWREQALANGVVINVNTHLADVPPIEGSEGELREVLVNLILNAVDALPEGGEITLTTSLDGDAVVLEVKDSGTGMTDEVRQRCLEPFFTTKGPNGTGLGLAMVYGTIQRHRGTLDIASLPGQGTAIRLRFPIRTTSDEAEIDDDDVIAERPTPRRILVVDDEPAVRHFLIEYLTRDGHAVMTATNGRDGWQAFLAGAFDLVVTDRAMPDVGGEQLAAAIKRRSPETPVIMLTGFGDIMAASGEHPWGVDLLVGKPVTIRALRNAIRRVTEEGIRETRTNPG